MQQAAISSYAAIRDGRLTHNGIELYTSTGGNGDDFLADIYRALGINYPKFYKMDNLSKTGFLAAEAALKQGPLSADPYDIGLVFSTAHGSLDTDLRYMATVPEAPGPALFVYTLPNILMGELAIKHGQKGESACFVFDIFDVHFQTAYINSLFEAGKVKKCIAGWADFYDGKAEAFFYIIEPKQNDAQPNHDTNTVSKIFKEVWKN